MRRALAPIVHAEGSCAPAAVTRAAMSATAPHEPIHAGRSGSAAHAAQPHSASSEPHGAARPRLANARHTELAHGSVSACARRAAA